MTTEALIEEIIQRKCKRAKPAKIILAVFFGGAAAMGVVSCFSLLREGIMATGICLALFAGVLYASSASYYRKCIYRQLETYGTTDEVLEDLDRAEDIPVEDTGFMSHLRVGTLCVAYADSRRGSLYVLPLNGKIRKGKIVDEYIVYPLYGNKISVFGPKTCEALLRYTSLKAG